MNKKFGLIGEKLPHSFSKILHTLMFKHLKLNYEYDLYEVDINTAKNIKEFILENNLDGINVTIPYKETVMCSLDEISKEAKEIGAVNTILNKDGKLIGYNTDYYGFLYTLKKYNINVQNNICVVLGTGGASKAIIQCLKDLKAKKIYIVSRNKENKSINNESLIDYTDLKNINGEVLINTTPVGMYPNIDFSPVDENIVRNFNNVVDIVYNPLETKLMKISKEENVKACCGIDMLIMQGLKSEEIWNEFTLLDIDIKEITDNVIREIY